MCRCCKTKHLNKYLLYILYNNSKSLLYIQITYIFTFNVYCKMINCLHAFSWQCYSMFFGCGIGDNAYLLLWLVFILFYIVASCAKIVSTVNHLLFFLENSILIIQNAFVARTQSMGEVIKKIILEHTQNMDEWMFKKNYNVIYGLVVILWIIYWCCILVCKNFTFYIKIMVSVCFYFVRKKKVYNTWLTEWLKYEVNCGERRKILIANFQHSQFSVTP